MTRRRYGRAWHAWRSLGCCRRFVTLMFGWRAPRRRKPIATIRHLPRRVQFEGVSAVRWRPFSTFGKLLLAGLANLAAIVGKVGKDDDDDQREAAPGAVGFDEAAYDVPDRGHDGN